MEQTLELKAVVNHYASAWAISIPNLK